MELNDFIVKAKIATYASERETNEKVLQDGTKELVFVMDNFKYRDRYYGFNPFIGEELIWQDDNIVWAMNYWGRIYFDFVSPKKVYSFLKSALRQVKVGRPFRGPSNFVEGDFEYIDKSNGSIDNFTGTEIIIYKGKEIYKLYYHGGLM